MGLAHSPRIVTDGLIFAYDMANTVKSWKGAPTTNLVLNASTMSGWNNYSNGPAAPYITDLGTTGWYMNNAGSWNGCYRSISGVTPGTYTFSCWSKYLGGHPNQTGGSVYISGWGGGDTAVYINKNISGWQRIKHTLNVTTTALTFYLISWGGTNNSDNSSWQVTMPQMEAGSVVTPFVNGTRSTTQAVLDLTNNSTVTAGGLTYASDNTFNFDYTGPGYVSVPLATAFNKTEGTMNFWLYPTRYNGGNGYFVNREDATANAVDWFWIGPYSGSFYFRIGNGVDCCSNDLAFGSFPTLVPLNSWVNMCFTWKANGTSAIYKNGVLYISRSIGNIPNTNPAPNGRFGLGHGNADSYYNGKMPVAQIYNRQFTAAEVAQNFNALRGRYGL